MGPEDGNGWSTVTYKRGGQRRRCAEQQPAARRSFIPRRVQQPSQPSHGSSYTRPGTQRPCYTSLAPPEQHDRHFQRSSSDPGRHFTHGSGRANSKANFKPPASHTFPKAKPQLWVQSTDPDFSPKVRVLYKLIKLVHHHNNISGPDLPPMINKTTQYLAGFIRAACPSEDTLGLLTQNAHNWADTAIFILQSHYDSTIFSHIQELTSFLSQEWRGPFQIAVTWAKRNLGRRLQPGTILRVESLLNTHLSEQPDILPGHGAQNDSPPPLFDTAPSPGPVAPSSVGTPASIPEAHSWAGQGAEGAAPPGLSLNSASPALPPAPDPKLIRAQSEPTSSSPPLLQAPWVRPAATLPQADSGERDYSAIAALDEQRGGEEKFPLPLLSPPLSSTPLRSRKPGFRSRAERELGLETLTQRGSCRGSPTPGFEVEGHRPFPEPCSSPSPPAQTVPRRSSKRRLGVFQA